MSLWWPVDNPRVTGGWANSPQFYAQYGQRGHNGIDMGMPIGTPVYAADAGVIDFEGWGQNHSWMGNPAGISVLIRHPWGYTGYAHLSNTVIDRGQSVGKGQLIGHSGSTGASTGPHLHFETLPANPDFRNGFAGRVDPGNYGLVPRGTTSAPAPATLAAHQRQAGSAPVNRRLEPNTSKPPIEPQLKAGEVGNFNGWIRGETVSGNNVWFRGISGNWFWSGGFTSQSTAGLADLNPAPAPAPTPPPAPAPVPPKPVEPAPVTPAPPARTPVTKIIPNWDGTAPAENPVYPKPQGADTIALPASITETVSVPSPNGYTQGRPGKPNHIVLHHTAGTSLTGAVAALSGGNGAPTASYVVQDSQLVSMVPEDCAPWTNGRWASNLWSVTFEMVNAGGTSASGFLPPSPDTMETTAWAMARAAVRWGIEQPLEYGVNVFGHRDVSKSSTACPGSLDMLKVIARANEIIKATPVKPGVTPTPGVVPEPGIESDTMVSYLESLKGNIDAIINLIK